MLRYWPYFTCLFFFLSAYAFGQTPGMIIKRAGTGAAVLDPNNDGYVSQSPAGFTSNDQTQSEIPYKPIPVPAAEPNSDLGPGPDCSFTDFVDSGIEDPVLSYFDGTNLMFRMRMGGYAPNSKGYSLMIDTDQKFGFSGPNADPNARVGNPGFEIEISLQTNFRVALYDVDGSTSPVMKASFPFNDYVQQSIALTTNCGNADYFYDFFIPFSAITAQFPSITTSTPLRMVAITTMNPAPAIGNNAQSDVGGIDDQAYGYNIDKIFEQIIGNFYPTPVTDINTGFPADRTSCPDITSSVGTGSTAISGTSSEADGTAVTIYKNGSSWLSATVAGGTWTATGVNGLVAGDVITASATAPFKTESVQNCTTITVALSCSGDVTINASNTNTKNIGGSGVVGSTIKIYQGGVSLTPSPVSSAVVDATGTFCWKSNGNTGSCNGGAGNLSGGYKITQTESGKCESPGIYVCVSGGQTAAPTITTSPITTTSTSISGTSVAGATVEIYSGSAHMATVMASGTSWTASGLTFTAGQVITAKAISGTLCLSNASPGVTVASAGGAISIAPTITGSYCTSSAISSISGTSVEAAGTTISLYNGVVLLGTTSTSSVGIWTVTGLSLTPGTTVTATATATGKSTSASSNSVTIAGTSSNGGLTVATGITEGQATVTGTTSVAGIVKVYVDGSLLGTANVTGSGWSYTSSSPATEIYAGGSVTATITIGSNCESTASAAVTIQCSAPSTSVAVSPTTAALCVGATSSITLTGSQSNVIYQLYDGGSTSGSSELGGGTITLNSAALSANATLTVRAIKISSFACNSTLTGSQVVTVTSPVTSNTLTAPAITSFCGTGNPGVITGSSPAGGDGSFTYQWQSSPDGTNFTDIAGATAQNYDPPSINTTTHLRRVVTSGSCSSISPPVGFTVTPTTLTNAITDPATTIFCNNGDPAAINGSVATGGAGGYTYKWQSSSDNDVFVDVTPAQTGLSYDPPLTANTIYFRRLVSSGSCSDFPSNVVKISVASASTSLIFASPTSITANGSSTSIITIQLKDASGNNLTVSACTPVLSTTLGSLSSVADNGNGTYTATLTSSASTGNAVVSGTLSGTAMTDNEVVSFVSSGVPSVATSAISASPSTIIANGLTTSIITVQLKDDSGNNITTGGATVLLSATAGTITAVTDNSNGTYTATLTSSTTAGQATVTGTVDGNPITDNELVTFIAGPASTSSSTISASVSSITADGVATSIITVQLKDLHGNNLTSGGAVVSLFTSLGNLGSISDNGDGSYTAILTSSTTAGNSVITGTVSGSPITDNETVAFVPGIASESTSLITASPSSITANGTSTSTITVQLKDANGNNLTTGGSTVTLTSTLGTLSAVTDNGNGTYTATLTSSTTAGNAVVTGTVSGTAITDNETVAFVTGAASASTSLITASASSITANGTSTSTITVQLKDANGNNLNTGGSTVTLTSTLGTLSAVTDNGNGTYSATLTSSTTAGNAVITGTVGGTAISDNETVAFVTGAASASTSLITASASSITANGTSTSTITVQLKDANGNNLTTGGATVTLNSTLGTLSAVTDNGNGTYTATLTSSTTAGNAVITGTVGGTAITDNETVAFVPGIASALASEVVASHTQQIADGVSVTTLTVQLKDANGNIISTGGHDVGIEATLGTLSEITDNGDGTYTATLTSPTSVGVSIITATLDNVSMTDSPTVTFIPGAADVATSTIKASPTNISANGVSTSTITVQLRDVNGNALTNGGDMVSLLTTAGTLGTITDNNDGTYTATLTSGTIAENAFITGEVNGADIADDETVQFIAGTASAVTSTITASTNALTADGISITTLTIRLKDENGNDITAGGDNVAVETTSGTVGTVMDNGDGTYTVTLTAPTASGHADVTATVNGSPLDDAEMITFTPGPASPVTSLITAATNTLAADGTSTTTVTIQLSDINGNLLTTGGDAVTLTTTMGTISSVIDNNNGTYSATLTSSLAGGVATITGTVNGQAIVDDASVVFIPMPLNINSTINSTFTSLPANGVSNTEIVITLKDDQDNPVVGADVFVSTTLGTVSLVIDNGDGTYTAILTSPLTAGTATVTFSVNGETGSKQIQVVFTPVTAETVFFIPEGFSPDGDGVNDTFVIQGIENMNVSLKIFNRWGVMVYESKRYQNDWAGLASHGVVIGERLPDGTYFYVVDLNDGTKPFVRSMTIKRK